MLHGRVVRPHVRTVAGIGAHVVAVDDRAASSMPGVVAVVREGDFVGVVAEREEQAIRAAEALRVTWCEPPALPEQARTWDALRAMPAETREIVREGDVDAAFAAAAVTHAATFRQAWQAHASMGPSCAVADVRGDGATVYASSQNVYGLAQGLAALLGMASGRVRVVFREGSGCYGHNGVDDVAADAAVLSRAVRRPVRVQWSRQDEFAWEPKGPAMCSDVRAGLDGEGRIAAWDATVWTPTHSTRSGGDPGRLFAGQLVAPAFAPSSPGRFVGGDRNAPTTYAIPNQRVTMRWVADRRCISRRCGVSAGCTTPPPTR
jgi:CO/xanthine dehydrogenase Mo-binding subunit